jgi:membrane protein YqaA with SNARE-associated domain
VDAFGWPELVALLASIGFGIVSAIVPIVNAEAYVIASQMSAVIGPIPIAIGIAIGQTIGKLLPFGVREAERLCRHRRAQKQRPIGPARARFRAVMAKRLTWSARTLGTSDRPHRRRDRLPPLYAVALLAGATTMRPLWFGLTVFVGRLCRFVLVASGFHGLHDWFF